MSTEPVNLRFLQAGLLAWLRAQIPGVNVLWDRSERPRTTTTDPVVLCRVVSGPTVGREGSTVTSRLLPERVVVRVTGTTGVAVVAEASGRRWDYGIQDGDTLEDIRDGLMSRMTAEPTIPATITARGTDGVEVEGYELGDLWNLSVRGPLAVEVEEASTAEVEAGDVGFVVEVEALSSQRYFRGGAHQALTHIQGSLRKSAGDYLLDAYGVSLSELTGTGITDLSGLSGSKYETRAVLRFGASMRSVDASPAILIEEVDLTLNARDGRDLNEEISIP